MADEDISSPMLSSPPSDHPHFVVDVVGDDDDEEEDNHQQPPSEPEERTSSSINGGGDSCRNNPYAFLISDWFDVPRQLTLNPFRNNTPDIGGGGTNECIKIIICLPLAAVRLVLFGLCLVVGYLATKLAY